MYVNMKSNNAQHLPGFETITSIVSGLYLTRFGTISVNQTTQSTNFFVVSTNTQTRGNHKLNENHILNIHDDDANMFYH